MGGTNIMKEEQQKLKYFSESEISKIAQDFGYSQMISKNPYMLSFKNDSFKKNIRINVYVTTGTITVQAGTKYFSMGEENIYRSYKNCLIGQFADILDGLNSEFL